MTFDAKERIQFEFSKAIDLDILLNIDLKWT